uniref:Terminase GpA n=1 Tax=uncultured marine virus TaxID=186617 RepID=A0A0F7L6A7_9VIRU|nr:terminase GpA [uncultured marine virus]
MRGPAALPRTLPPLRRAPDTGMGAIEMAVRGWEGGSAGARRADIERATRLVRVPIMQR